MDKQIAEGEAWTEVASCTWLHQAEVLRSVLDAAGIPVRIPDEQTLGIQPFYATLLGGVRLLVHERDVERARALLDAPALDSADIAEGEGRSR